jgi:hypothetical protein
LHPAALIFSALIFTLTSCSGPDKAVRTSEYPACKTIVEGFLHAGEGYFGHPGVTGPAIRIMRSGDIHTLHGNVVRETDKGIFFLPKKEGFFTPDTDFYPYEQLLWVVDENNKLIRGEISEEKKAEHRVVMVLSHSGKPDAKEVSVELKANERFSYCLNPGKYQIARMLYQGDNRHVDVSDSLPLITLTVEPDVVNYVGDLYIDASPDSVPGVHKLKADVLESPGKGDAGFFGGIIGSLVYDLTKGTPPTHTFSVEMDSAFAPTEGAKFIISLFTFQDSLSRSSP